MTAINENRTLPTKVLVFEVANQGYALPLSAVVEVVPAVRITPVPGGPRIIEGVINFRGRLAAVLGMRLCLGFPASGPAPTNHFVVAKLGRRLLALHVDRAVGITSLESEAVEPASQVSPKVESISGVAKLPDGLIMIYDLENFLSEAEENELDTVLAPAREEPQHATP